MPRVRIAGGSTRRRPNLADSIVSKLNASRPQNDDSTVEFARTSNRIISHVTAVLRLGLEPFDEVTGGLPFGRAIEIYGLDGSGKSAIAIKAGVQAQLGTTVPTCRGETDKLETCCHR